jgi:hypothetical protein
MLSMSAEVIEVYEQYLSKRKVDTSSHGEYSKYLSDFLYFCNSLNSCNDNAQCVRLFLHTLEENGLPLLHRQHAANAVSLYLQMLREAELPSEAPIPVRLEDSIASSTLDTRQLHQNYIEIPDGLPTHPRSVLTLPKKLAVPMNHPTCLPLWTFPQPLHLIILRHFTENPPIIRRLATPCLLNRRNGTN